MSIPVGEQILGAATLTVAGTVSLGAGTAAVGQVTLFRDSVVTVQATQQAAAPAAGTVVCSITPATAGFWEVSGLLWISGTTVAATDTNNAQLMQTTTSRLNPILAVVPGTSGMAAPVALPTLVLNLSAADTVNIKAIGNATAGSVYAATIVARRVG